MPSHLSAPSSALLLLSGGMDSATLLWWMKDQGIEAIHTVAIDYGQRHRVELDYSRELSARAGAASHKVLQLDLRQFGGNPLTSESFDVPDAEEGRQGQTVVPFRNMLFVTLAATHSEVHRISDLYISPVRDDFDAYRDCRRVFYDSLEVTLGLGAAEDAAVRVHTPFIHRWKSDIVRLGLSLDVPYGSTHTCYRGQRPACGVCDACVERIAAFRLNGTADPLPYGIDIEWNI